jgi:hypothetical protein
MDRSSEGLERTVLPGLGVLKSEDIKAVLATKIEVPSPAAAGLAWLSSEPITPYHRTGVVQHAVSELSKEPFGRVHSLPTVDASFERMDRKQDGPNVVDALRSASAQFQSDVALLMRSGVGSDSGAGVLWIGYVPLITIPFMPGTAVEAAASVEIVAIDVRTGVLLGAAQGRGRKSDGYVRPRKVDEVREQLIEEALKEAVAEAASGIREQLQSRLHVASR